MTVEEENQMLRDAFAEAMARADISDAMALALKESAEYWKEAYAELKARVSDPEASDTELDQLRELARKLTAQATDQELEIKRLQDEFKEAFDRNEELYGELLREKAKNLMQG